MKEMTEKLMIVRCTETGWGYNDRIDMTIIEQYLDGDFLTVDYNFKELGYKDGDEVKLIIVRP